MTERLVTAISRFARIASGNEVDRLCSALATGALDPNSNRRSTESILGRRQVVVDACTVIQSEWAASGLGSDALVLAIRSATAVKNQLETETTSLEMVWTGPRPHGSTVRATSEVMREMIGGARHSTIVLGYSITRGGDRPSSATTVLDDLAEARRRLDDVTVIMNDTAENRSALIESWPVGVPLPRLLTWVGDPSKPYASLHAKVLIVDYVDLLITSANLTHHGLDANLELGVRLRGPFVGGVVKHLTLLEREGHLVRPTI